MSASVRFHCQDTNYYCGAAVAMMALFHWKQASPLQKDLYAQAEAVSKNEEVMMMPAGLLHLLGSAPQKYDSLQLNSRDEVAGALAARSSMPGFAMIGRGHWVLVQSVKTGDVGGIRKAQSFTFKTPREVAGAPHQHLADGSCCAAHDATLSLVASEMVERIVPVTGLAGAGLEIVALAGDPPPLALDKAYSEAPSAGQLMASIQITTDVEGQYRLKGFGLRTPGEVWDLERDGKVVGRYQGAIGVASDEAIRLDIEQRFERPVSKISEIWVASKQSDAGGLFFPYRKVTLEGLDSPVYARIDGVSVRSLESSTTGW